VVKERDSSSEISDSQARRQNPQGSVSGFRCVLTSGEMMRFRIRNCAIGSRSGEAEKRESFIWISEESIHGTEYRHELRTV
jgi:hypothetical protein